MKAIIILNYASEEDIGKKTSIRLRNEENAWIEEVVIKPMPEKKAPSIQLSARHNDEHMEILGLRCTDYEKGWNACLEELEK